MLELVKDSIISVIKSEVNNMIIYKYPLWKQLNYTLQLDVNNYDNIDEINTMKKYISDLLKRSKEIQDEINACSTIEEIENIDKTL